MLGFMIGLFVGAFIGVCVMCFAIQQQRQMSIWKNILMMKIKNREQVII